MTVVERRKVVGGAAVTEEFHPGFRNSVAAYTVSLLNPKIIADLALAEHGLNIVERRAQNFLPAPDGSYLLTGEGRTLASVAKLSAHDAEAIEGFSRELEAIADVLRQLRAARAAEPGRRFWRGRDPRSVSTRSAPPTSCAACRWSSSATCSTCSRARPARCWTSASSTTWSRRCSASTPSSAIMPAPTPPGSAYVMLHHAFGEVNGKKGVWGHAIGGMGAITQAMARAARAAGAEIVLEAGVREVIVEKDRAAGVDPRQWRDHPREICRLRASIRSCSIRG